jgi:hypothetical protein
VARIVLIPVIVALGAFCVVQDRVTAAGARRYVRVHRDAAVRGAAAPSIDEVMRPAVRQSVWYGALSGGAAAGVALGAGALWGRRSRRD